MNEPSIKTRLYSPLAGNPFLCLNDSETLTIKKTLRFQENDIICCFNGDGNDYVYRLDKSEKKEIHLNLLHKEVNQASILPQTTVLLASTKGKTKDRMVRDLTPLGVTEIIFYKAERSVALPDQKLKARLQKIAIESCRQCERATIPEVVINCSSLEMNLNKYFQSETQLIYFYERQEISDQNIQLNNKQPVLMVFGPEGGFTHNELAALQQYGKALSMGPRILRAELAAVVGTSLIQQQRGLLA